MAVGGEGLWTNPPEGCRHYEDPQELPSPSRKYFHQRYSIFSRYDEGIWMTEDAWFGVTPEPIANKIASNIAEAAPEDSCFIIDAFAGVGGNAIAFALSGRWKRVYAVEKDSATLECARHNARIYGVENLISFHHGDCFDVILKQLDPLASSAVLFASPPWGGPSYQVEEVFNLETMEPYSLQHLMESFTPLFSEIVLYLPRTSDLSQLAPYIKVDDRVNVMHYLKNGYSKALCAYFGSWGEIV